MRPDEDEPRWITEAILLAIHARQIERHGGAHGVRDENVVRSSLARAIHRWAYDGDADIADLAGTYLVSFARAQGFVDGNNRIGLASALVFLRLNGYELHVPPPELYALTMRVATSQDGDAVVGRYLREKIVVP